MNAATTSPSKQSEANRAELRSTLDIIVVDDDPYVVDLLRSLLLDLGVGDVRGATDGPTVLRQLAGRRADLLICDVNMPGMDGIELLRHVANLADQPALMLITAEGHRIRQTAHQLADAHQLQVLAALPKPLRRERLEALLDQLVEQGDDPEALDRLAANGPGHELPRDEVQLGLTRGALVPWFQPVIDTTGGRLRGFEALARWHHPTRGILPPSAFLWVAERSGLMSSLTHIMLEASLAQAGRWHRAGLDLEISMNVSVLDLEDPGFFGWLMGAIQERGVPPNRVTIEITESRIVDRFTRALETLTRLGLRRVAVAIDDHDAAARIDDHVRRLPVSELKIEGVSHARLDGDPARLARVQSAVSLASEFEFRTVAEGVETEADWTLARGLGIDRIQGHVVAAAMPAEEATDWIAAWR